LQFARVRFFGSSWFPRIAGRPIDDFAHSGPFYL
jgi:hypothetical protein